MRQILKFICSSILLNRKPETLRGKDLTDMRMKALEHLNELNLSTTLVVTLQKGLNDDEIGKIIEFACNSPACEALLFSQRR